MHGDERDRRRRSAATARCADRRDHSARLRAAGERDSEPSTVVLARLRRRKTATSLRRRASATSRSPLAVALSVVALSGGQRSSTIAGGAFLGIVLGFSVRQILSDLISSVFFENWRLRKRGD